VLAVSTPALIVFHELGAPMGVVTKKGLLALVQEHYGPRDGTLALSALVVATSARCAPSSPASPPGSACSPASAATSASG
jgi:Mn2+/Fe2+ NRAMP family transporter